jgi:hypothetical protein
VRVGVAVGVGVGVAGEMMSVMDEQLRMGIRKTSSAARFFFDVMTLHRFGMIPPWMPYG